MSIKYSETYQDGALEYCIVKIPLDKTSNLDREALLSEQAVQELGVQLGHNWIHYAWYKYEPYVLLFKRYITFDKHGIEEHLK